LKLVAAGNEQAFREIYERYQGKIYAYAYHLTKLRETAREVVQTVFIRLWEKRADIDPDDNFEGYVIRITQNHILNLLRDAARDRERRAQVYRQLEQIRNQPEERLWARELTRIYREAIAQLPPRQQLIYHLRENEALSHAAIGAQLNISPLTAKKHMVEAVRFIRHYVNARITLPCLLLACCLPGRLG